jgi:L-lactate dehydrogenase complex protein LldE
VGGPCNVDLVPKVALFVTCVADQIFPDTAEATVRVLEAAGAQVVFPARQTCCGQPALTAGEPEAAARLAHHHLDVFGDFDAGNFDAANFDAANFDAIVTPSGSCAAIVCHHYPTLLTERRAEAETLAARTFELTQYLVDVLGVDDIGARLDATVTVHDACHGLRNLGLGDGMRRLLERAGATLVEMKEPDTCCGFGGVFSFGYPEVSTRLADAKLGHAAATAARYVVSTDLACLMHLDGRRRKIGPPTAPQPIHIADLLAAGLTAASR